MKSLRDLEIEIEVFATVYGPMIRFWNRNFVLPAYLGAAFGWLTAQAF